MMNVDQIYPPEMKDVSNEMKKAYLLSAPDRHVELSDRMIAWAEARLGHAEYAGWCLSFAEDALEISNGIEIFGGDSARESYDLYQDDWIHSGPSFQGKHRSVWPDAPRHKTGNVGSEAGQLVSGY